MSTDDSVQLRARAWHLGTRLDLLQNRQGIRLERYIVILIAAEILLILDDSLEHTGEEGRDAEEAEEADDIGDGGEDDGGRLGGVLAEGGE